MAMDRKRAATVMGRILDGRKVDPETLRQVSIVLGWPRVKIIEAKKAVAKDPKGFGISALLTPTGGDSRYRR